MAVMRRVAVSDVFSSEAHTQASGQPYARPGRPLLSLMDLIQWRKDIHCVTGACVLNIVIKGCQVYTPTDTVAGVLPCFIKKVKTCGFQWFNIVQVQRDAPRNR